MGDTSRIKVRNRCEATNRLDLWSGINGTKERISQSTHAVDDYEIPISVLMERTTFTAVYGVANGFVELMSPDLGERTAPLEGRPAEFVAKELLRTMATEEISRTEIPFMPDYAYKIREPAKAGEWTSLVNRRR